MALVENLPVVENRLYICNFEIKTDGICSSIKNENVGNQTTPRNSIDSATCRVCQCIESDRRGDAALGFLDIDPPLQEVQVIEANQSSNCRRSSKASENDNACDKNSERKSGVAEFVSPDGEVFVCNIDLEAGSCDYQDTLICLGCSCKNDLALAHYACALKWFVSHGSTTCEICGSVAKNVRPSDFKNVMSSLKDYETLMQKTVSGQPTSACIQTNSGVDPDAVAAIRRQRLSEIALWFNPHINSNNDVNNDSRTLSMGLTEQTSNVLAEEAFSNENPATKWAVEITGILVATGLLTVTLAWLIAPRVGKRTAKNGLHILLGGVCALTVVIFLRFMVLSRIKYGPARYWAILFIFWFLVFGIWASRTHGTHNS